MSAVDDSLVVVVLEKSVANICKTALPKTGSVNFSVHRQNFPPCHRLAQCWIRRQMVRWPNLTAVLQLLALHKSVIGDDVVRWPVRLALHTGQFRGVEGNELQGTVAAGFTVDVAVGTPPQQVGKMSAGCWWRTTFRT